MASLQHIPPIVAQFPIVLFMAAVLFDVTIIARGGKPALRLAAARYGFSLSGLAAGLSPWPASWAPGVLIATAYFGGGLAHGLGVNVAPVKP